MGAAGRAAAQLDAVLVFAPVGHVRHEIDAERAAAREDAGDRLERRGEIAVGEQRLQNPVGGQDHRKRTRPERQRADVTADETQRIGELVIW